MQWIVDKSWQGDPLAEVAAIVRLTWDLTTAVIEVRAPWRGDPPPASDPGSTDRLWEHEVVELFLVGEHEQYTEIELGPHGHYLVLALEGIRQPVATGLALRSYTVRRDGDQWLGRAVIDRALLPDEVLTANAYAIFGQGPARTYCAAHPVPGPAPDFHRLAHFGPLPAAEVPAWLS